LKKLLRFFTLLFFLGTAGAVVFLFLRGDEFFQNGQKGAKKRGQTRVVAPQGGALSSEGAGLEGLESEKIPLEEGELPVLTLAEDLDGDLQEEQLLAYRDLTDPAGAVCLTCAVYDAALGGYRRVWSGATEVTRPGTLRVYTDDLVGDRSICILAAGMNDAGEHTLAVFRKVPETEAAEAAAEGGGEMVIHRIAEIRIDGAIEVKKTARSQAYQQGLTRGQSYSIAAYGRDQDSANPLDQVEFVYTYNPDKGFYEQTGMARVPGSQIEQRQFREFLSSTRNFERFIQGLWYYVSPEGTIDHRQYLYFDAQNREIIFFGEDAQQVFLWQNSSLTRYGIYAAGQNIAVTTLRRFLDIELESLDSIRVKVFEDVRLKIRLNDSWDGSYRKAGALSPAAGAEGPRVPAFWEAVYDGSLGTLTFTADGFYTLSSGNGAREEGRYAFYRMDGKEFLELRPQGAGRITYRVESAEQEPPYNRLTLVKVRLGTKGLVELHDAVISLARI